MIDPQADRPRTAAFFDIDGTLVRTTIVHYYAYFRRRRMPPLMAKLWYGLFLSKCLLYLVLDKINRSWFNTVFYRSYRGMPAADVRAQADECYRAVMKPTLHSQALPCVTRHIQDGHEVVLVTGSIDFLVAPLACELGADYVLAPKLVERDGLFTGELDGPPLGEEEKARRIRRFADQHDIDLSRSYAYGDSIADLPMLEAVGHPVAVNPDRRLAAVARRRNWRTECWTCAADVEAVTV